jgi:hypothetical protein
MHQLQQIAPAAYVRHPIHANDRVWAESNCYVDLWIELLHARGFDPYAALPFTVSVDFEGDQWTFFKFPLADLYSLYGIEVIELNIWRRLIRHIDEQLAMGRPSIVEVDAFHLPDTIGTSYHTEHVKTSIAVQALDLASRRLGYFHNAGYYELEGGDFAGLFRLEGDPLGGEPLPPYVEVAKFDRRPPLPGRVLVAASLDRLADHLARRPAGNPFHRYAAQFPADLESLTGASLATFHQYAFATFRQCGAAFELTATYLRWLLENGEHGLEPMAAACDVIATTTRALQLKTARFCNTNRSFDPAPMLDTIAAAWDQTMIGLTERYGAVAHRC